MQRFQVIGESRLQVVEAVAHEPRHVDHVVGVLRHIQPALVRFDLTPAQLDMALQGGVLGPEEALLFAQLQAHGAMDPYCIQRAAARWAKDNGAVVDLIAPLVPEPPGGRHARKLAKMVRKEGFDARDPVSAVDRFHMHYVSRVPDLAAWHCMHIAEMARGLVARHRDRKLDAVLVLSRPNADTLLDAVNLQLGRRTPEAPPRAGIPPPGLPFPRQVA